MPASPRPPSSTERPLVALTATVQLTGGERAQPAVHLYASYIEALERAGLAPVLLTPAHSPDAQRALLAVCQGLVLTGGEDVAPGRFQGVPHPALGRTTPARDELEWRALDAALGRGLPVLGICRGIQVLNVYLGGTLWQDLPAERPGGLDHDPPGDLGQRTHHVSLAEGSRLRAIVGGARILTNSSHHQAVRDVAPSLTVSAHTDDGVIEGLEAGPDTWLLAVQWHPERMPPDAPEDDPDRRLFQAFHQAVIERA